MKRTYSLSRQRNFFSGFSLTNKLILVNVVLFLFTFLLIGVYSEDFFTNNFALNPSFILSGEKLWTIFTSMFFHSGFLHLFANMFSLFFVGNFLEKLIGTKRFGIVYLVSGLVGSLFFILAHFLIGSLNIFAVGASGAIFGLLGILAVLVPYSRIYLIVGPLLLILAEVLFSELLPSSLLPFFNAIINILFFVMIFALFSFNESFRKIAVPIELKMWLLPIVAIVPLVVISFFIPLPIGNSAHFGGLVVGLVYGFYLRKKFPNKTMQLRTHFR